MLFLKIDFRERRKGSRRELELERNTNWLPSARIPTRDQTHNLGMCWDWELNPRPFSTGDDTPTN